ncbi:hypothetical protein ABKN59_004557 [Abortiporus biennis]
MPILYVDSEDAYSRVWLVARRTLIPRGGGEDLTIHIIKCGKSEPSNQLIYRRHLLDFVLTCEPTSKNKSLRDVLLKLFQLGEFLGSRSTVWSWCFWFHLLYLKDTVEWCIIHADTSRNEGGHGKLDFDHHYLFSTSYKYGPSERNTAAFICIPARELVFIIYWRARTFLGWNVYRVSKL